MVVSRTGQRKTGALNISYVLICPLKINTKQRQSLWFDAQVVQLNFFWPGYHWCCGLVFEDNPISDISFLFSSKNPNNPDIFIWSRILVKKRTLSKTRGGNELHSSYTSGKYILSALTRGLPSATNQIIIGLGLEKKSTTDSENSQSTLPHNYLRIARTH